VPATDDAVAPSVEWPSSGLLQPAGRVVAGGVPVLSGYVVAVAGDLRAHPLASTLEGQGARAVTFQATRTVPQAEATALAAATAAAVQEPADEVIVSSAFGLRAWHAAARAAGLATQLRQLLASARLLARDPRTADALREYGFEQIWSAPSNTTEDLFAYLLAHPREGARVVAQVDQEPVRELVRAMASSGAEVVEVLTTHPEPPKLRSVLHRLVEQIVRRQVDAVLVTATSCGEHLLEQAVVDGELSGVLEALGGDVALVCLGPLGAAPFVAHGVAPFMPARPMLNELPGVLAAELPKRSLHPVVGGHRLEIRGQAVIVEGLLIPVQAGPMAVLRALAQEPGRVLSAAEIRDRVPGWHEVDDHAIEMAVSRLRHSLEGTDFEGLQFVQTVVKRGYRLAT
jgi:uroporphyrinogen-III synthase